MSRVAKILRQVETKAKGLEGGLYLSWPSKPLIASPLKSRISLDCPIQVPNFDLNSNGPLSLKESTYYLLAPKQREREERDWKPWITKVEKVDPTTWRVLRPTLGVENLCKSNPSVLGELGKPSSYLIKELARTYTLVDDDNDQNNSTEMKAHKVLPLFDGGDIQLLALKWDGTLALLSKGEYTWTNNILANNGDGVFLDIAAHQGRFYATDSNDRLYIIDDNKARLITNTSDHAIFESIKEEEEEGCTYHVSLSLVEYDGQLRLLKFPGQFSPYNVVMAHRLGGDEQNWEVTKSLRNKILFKMNDVCFELPAHILDRKFEGDWICYCNDTKEQRNPSFSGRDIVRAPNVADFERGLQPLDYISLPIYHDCFNKCILNTDTNMDTTVPKFRYLPDDEYVSLFFPPPPWIQYYCLDPHQGYPAVRFDQCYLHDYDFARHFLDYWS